MHNYAQPYTSLIADCRPLHIIHYSLFPVCTTIHNYTPLHTILSEVDEPTEKEREGDCRLTPQAFEKPAKNFCVEEKGSTSLERGKEMEENYILSVTGMQTVEESQDKIELKTMASYVTKNGSRYITYKEYDAQHPAKKYRTTIKVDADQVVTVMKGGAESHNLILEKGQRHKCEYITSFGVLSLGVYTEYIHVDLDDHGGELTVRYIIDIQSELASKNELHLKIEEAQQNVNSESNS